MTSTSTSTSTACSLHFEQLEAAHERVTRAYRAARHGVYDVVPPGPVDHELLTGDQLRLLDELDAAERRLVALRGSYSPRHDQIAC